MNILVKSLVKEYKAKDQSASIYIVSYPGHVPSRLTQNTYKGRFTLQEQVDHKILTLQRLWKTENLDDKKVNLVGHSIGGYMALMCLGTGIFDFHSVIPIMPSIQNFTESPNADGCKKCCSYFPNSLYYCNNFFFFFFFFSYLLEPISFWTPL